MNERKREEEWRSAWKAWFGGECDPPSGFGPPPGFFGIPGFGPGGRGPRSGPGRRWGGRGRVFDRGDLKYAILRLLTRKPMHGYEVMQALEEETGGWYSASAGSVYPALQLLQDQGYVTSVETEGRRVYSISEDGRGFLDEHADRADDVMDRVSEFAGRFASGTREMEGVVRSLMRFAREGFEQATRAAGDPAAAARMREILDRATEEMRAAAGKGAPPEGGHESGGHGDEPGGRAEGKPLDEL